MTEQERVEVQRLLNAMYNLVGPDRKQRAYTLLEKSYEAVAEMTDEPPDPFLLKLP
jgi:hypothetical protein